MQSLLIVALALATGLLASVVVNDRLDTTLSIRDSSEPVVVAAREIQANLAEADAAAANAFLAGGVEDANQRQRYELALESAGVSIAEAASRIGDDQESVEAIEAIQKAVGEYAGLVETARVNNRLGFPVGAAYLNTASSLLTDPDGVYVQTDVIANNGASRYRDDYNGLLGTGLIPLVIAALLAIGLLIALLRTQTYISNTFRRRFNAPLAGATVLSMVLVAWLVISFVGQATSLQSAREDGFNGVRQYVDARALGFRAKGSESRFLIARGGGDISEFDADADRLVDGDDSGLLIRALDDADSSGERNAGNDALAEWQSYRRVHDRIVAAAADGEREEAESLALGESNTEFDDFSAAVDRAVDRNQQQFDSSMDGASDALKFLTYGSLVVAFFIALLALFGIQQRINEYR